MPPKARGPIIMECRVYCFQDGHTMQKINSKKKRNNCIMSISVKKQDISGVKSAVNKNIHDTQMPINKHTSNYQNTSTKCILTVLLYDNNH